MNMSMNSISDIKNIYYINLDSRTDRRHHVENELKRLGFKGIRFPGIKMDNGALGCSYSHLQILKMAQKMELDHVLILEDDIQFLKPLLFVHQFNQFLSRHDSWDVVLIAGNNMGYYESVDNTCIKITKCQTTTGYLVKKQYYQKLIENIEEGINKLTQEPHNSDYYAIDEHWGKLQQTDNWYLITPLTVIQKPDYSDIAKIKTNYSLAMLYLDKEKFFRQLHKK